MTDGGERAHTLLGAEAQQSRNGTITPSDSILAVRTCVCSRQAGLPLRLGMTLTAGRCDPQTSAGIIANETATGCGSAADNAALAPSPLTSASA